MHLLCLVQVQSVKWKRYYDGPVKVDLTLLFAVNSKLVLNDSSCSAITDEHLLHQKRKAI